MQGMQRLKRDIPLRRYFVLCRNDIWHFVIVSLQLERMEEHQAAVASDLIEQQVHAWYKCFFSARCVLGSWCAAQ